MASSNYFSAVTKLAQIFSRSVLASTVVLSSITAIAGPGEETVLKTYEPTHIALLQYQALAPTPRQLDAENEMIKARIAAEKERVKKNQELGISEPSLSIFENLQAIEAQGDLSKLTTKERNVLALTRMIETAVASGAKIIAAPEGSNLGYEHLDPVIDNPERYAAWGTKEGFAQQTGLGKFIDRIPLEKTRKENGPELNNNGWAAKHFENLAKKHGVYLVIPTIAKYNSSGKIEYANMATVFGPEGRVLDHIKANFWPHETLYKGIVGTKRDFFDTRYGRFALEICNGIFPMGMKISELNPHMGIMLSSWAKSWWPGFQGFSKNGDFDFLSSKKYIDVPIAAADDSRRTVLNMPKPGDVVRLPDNGGKGSGNGIVLVKIQASDIALADGRPAPKLVVSGASLMLASQDGRVTQTEDLLPFEFTHKSERPKGETPGAACGRTAGK